MTIETEDLTEIAVEPLCYPNDCEDLDERRRAWCASIILELKQSPSMKAAVEDMKLLESFLSGEKPRAHLKPVA